MLILVGGKLINTSMCSVIERDSRSRQSDVWIARFTDGTNAEFQTSEDMTEHASRIVPAQVGYFLLTLSDGQVFSEAVVAFGILPADDTPPTVYTVRGKADLGDAAGGVRAGLLCPDGQVVTFYELYSDRDAFVASGSASSGKV